MGKIGYSKVCKFQYKGNYYQMFKAQRRKIAFLRIDENGGYSFPTYKEFEELVKFFETHRSGNIAAFSLGRHGKVGFAPKVLENVGGKVKLVAVTSAMVASILTGCGNNVDYSESDYYVYDDSDIQLDMEVSDTSDDYISEYDDIQELSDEDLFAVHDTDGYVTTLDYELLNYGSPKSVVLYNNRYFEDFFGVENYSLNEIISVLDSNKDIPNEYRPYIKDFIQKMYAYYPNLEWRVFVYNLSTLRIDLKTGNDMEFMCSDALAFYNSDDNIMVINTDYDIESNELGLVTFRHELGHMLNNVRLNTKDYKVRYYFKVGGEGKYLQEGLNVILTSEPFLDEYSEQTKRNMGYSITTNVSRVLIDCLDYDIQDSVSNNVYDFERRLGELMPDEMDPSVFEQLLEVQWIDCASGEMVVDDADYADFYAYIARLYINTHLTPDSSYDDVISAQENLIGTLTTGIYHTEYIYSDVIESEFNNFMELNNISVLSR